MYKIYLQAAFWAAVYVFIINFNYPFIGLDLAYNFPRALEHLQYFVNNGYRIQWWSPSFGGGLPSFPSANQTQFSLFQSLLFLVNPWSSVMIVVFINVFISFLFYFKLNKEVFNFTKDQSILATTLFFSSGYIMQHLLIGHLFFLEFVWFPIFAYLLLHQKNLLLTVSILALMMAYLFHNAGFYMLVNIFFALSLLFLVMLSIKKIDLRKLINIILTLVCSLMLTLAIAFAKLNANSEFAGNFPRINFIKLDWNVFQAFSSWLIQLFHYQLFFPFYSVFKLSKFYKDYFRFDMGIWEVDSSLSPIFIVLLVTIIFTFNYKSKINWANFDFIWIVLLVVFFIIYFSFLTTIGPIYDFLKSLPFLKSFSSNIKFTSSLVPVIIYIFILLLNKSKIAALNKSQLFIVILAQAVIFLFAYIKICDYSKGHYKREQFTVNPKQMTKLWNSILKGTSNITVEKIAYVKDCDALTSSSSAIYTYESVFTTGESAFQPKLSYGNTSLIYPQDSTYNITHPVSLLKDNVYGLNKWSRISVKDSVNFKNFISLKKVDWELSQNQKRANRISLYSLIFVCLILIGSVFMPRLKLKLLY